jgi:hypothetical protein
MDAYGNAVAVLLLLLLTNCHLCTPHTCLFGAGTCLDYSLQGMQQNRS